MAAGGKPITIRIAGDEKDLERALLNAQKRLDGLKSKLDESAGTAERTGLFHKRLGDLAGGAGDKFKELADNLTGHFGPAGQKANDLIGGMADKLGGVPVAAGAAAAGVGVAAVALYKLGETGVAKFTEIADQTRRFQQVAGVTAEQASALADASDDLGVGADNAAAAMQKLSLNSGKNAEQLAAHGVAIAHDKDGNVDLQQTLYNVADAFQATTDPTKRAEIGTLAFGKAWGTMIPLLAQGSQGLREMAEESKKQGVVLSQKDVDQARELQLNIKELKDSLDGMWVTIGRAVVPQLAEMAKGAAKVGEEISSLASHVGGLGNIFRIGLGIATGGFSELLRSLGKSKDEHEKMAQAAQQAADTAKQSYADYQQQVDETRQAQEALTNAILAQGNADLEYRQSQLATQEALQKQQEAATAAAQAIQEHGAESKEAQKATQDLDAAALSAESALLHQAGAAAQLREKQAEANGTTLDAKDKSEIYRGELEKLQDQLAPGNPVRAHIQGLIDDLNAIPSEKTVTVTVEQNVRGVGIDNQGGVVFRAGGGPLDRAQAAIVGEEGPELFVPDQAGKVVDAATSARILAGPGPREITVGQGGDAPTNVTNVYLSGVVGDEYAVARKIHEMLRTLQRASA